MKVLMTDSDEKAKTAAPDTIKIVKDFDRADGFFLGEYWRIYGPEDCLKQLRHATGWSQKRDHLVTETKANKAVVLAFVQATLLIGEADVTTDFELSSGIFEGDSGM